MREIESKALARNSVTLIFYRDSIFTFPHCDNVTKSGVIYLVSVGRWVSDLFFETWPKNESKQSCCFFFRGSINDGLNVEFLFNKLHGYTFCSHDNIGP